MACVQHPQLSPLSLFPSLQQSLLLSAVSTFKHFVLLVFSFYSPLRRSGFFLVLVKGGVLAEQRDGLAVICL